jgi:hypothetical protein
MLRWTGRCHAPALRGMDRALKISRNVLATVLVTAAVALAGGCAPGASNGDTTPPAATTTSTPASVASPTVVTTTTKPPLILTTPQAAAEHLYNAWMANDKATALLAATKSAVDALFAMKWKAGTYFFGGCTQPTAPSECDYNWAAGIIAMKIDGNATAGFRVIAVSTGSAG